MRISDNLSVSLRNLFKRKVRTLLTVIAVTAGTAMIVVMISLGLGMQRSYEETLKSMTSFTKLDIYHNPGENGLFVRDDTIRRVEALPGVVAATPVLDTYLYAMAGKRTGSFQVMGITAKAMAAMNFPIAEGRLLGDDDPWEIVYGSSVPNDIQSQRERDEQQRKWRAMFASGGGVIIQDSGASQEGPKYTHDMLDEKVQASVDWRFIYPDSSITIDEGYEDENAVAAPKPPKPYNLVGVGILSDESWEYSYNCYMQIDTVKKIVEDRAKYEQATYRRTSGQSNNDNGYSHIIIKAEDVTVLEDVTNSIKKMGFSGVYVPMLEDVAKMRKQSQTMQTFLGIIGGVTFIMAAIGIANTMIMSIYERTREIGVMKVIGATLKDIRNLFLTEAAAIGLIGGVFGVGISYGVSKLFTKYPQILAFLPDYSGEISIYVPLWLAGVALLFGTLVGLISGYFPARRAMKVSALQAILTQA